MTERKGVRSGDGNCAEIAVGEDEVSASYTEDGISVRITVTRKGIDSMLKRNFFKDLPDPDGPRKMKRFADDILLMRLEAKEMLSRTRDSMEANIFFRGGADLEKIHEEISVEVDSDGAVLAEVNIAPWLVDISDTCLRRFAAMKWAQNWGDDEEGHRRQDPISWLIEHKGIAPFLEMAIFDEMTAALPRISLKDADIEKASKLLVRERTSLFISMAGDGLFSPLRRLPEADAILLGTLHADPAVRDLFITALGNDNSSAENLRTLLPLSAGFAMTVSAAAKPPRFDEERDI